MATGNPEAWRLATEALADVVALSAAVDAVAADGAVATRKGA